VDKIASTHATLTKLPVVNQPGVEVRRLMERLPQVGLDVCFAFVDIINYNCSVHYILGQIYILLFCIWVGNSK
jgi:hypothetical protein